MPPLVQVGNLVTRINELGLSTNYSYDALNRLEEVAEPGSAATSFTYDLHGNQTSVTDAEGRVTTFSYDDFGNRLSRTSPDSGTTIYVYDTASNLSTKTDSNSTVVSYAYDTLNRVNSIIYPNASLNVSYTYDVGTNSIGRLSSTTDATGSTLYTFNIFGNLTEETRTIEGQSFTIRYNYNDTQELTSITYPSGRVVNYQRDAIGHVTGITSAYQGETTTVANSITNLPFGPATSLTLGNDLTLASDYDEQYRLTSSTAGDIYNKTYTYLATGQVETIADTLDITRSQSFTYDDLGRLTGASGSYGNLDYTYDRVGNRLSKTIDTLQTQYTYQPETNKLDQVIGSETTSYTYDAVGNTLTRDDLAFTWNENNRIASLDINAENAGTYGYDARGLRTVKTTEKGTVLSLYDSLGNLLAETDETGATLREYVYLGSQRLTLFDYTIKPEFAVRVSTSEDELLENVPTYAFYETGSYAGIYASTNEQGDAFYDREDFGEGPYLFRVNYLGAQFWSDPITVQQTNSVSVVIDVDEIETIVTMNGEVQEGINVYVFTESGSYLGLLGVTDSEGKVSFSLPVGENYKFRADLYGSQYWSDLATIGGGSSVSIETGGGTFNLTVLKDGERKKTGGDNPS